MENYLSDETLYFQVYLEAKKERVDLQTVHKLKIMKISQQTWYLQQAGNFCHTYKKT